MNNIYQNFRILTAHQRTPVFFIVFFFIIISFIEILGLSLIPVIFMKGIAGDGVILSSIFFDENFLFHITIVELSIFVVIIYSIKAGVFIFSQYKINQFVFDVMHKNQMQLIHSVINSNFLDIRITSVADHVNMIQLHINAASNNYLIPILQVISNAIIVLFVFVFLSFISFKLVLTAIIFVALLLVVYFKNIKGRAYELGKIISNANKNLIDLIKSLNTGWRLIKSLGCEPYIESRFYTESRVISQSKFKHSVIHFLPKPLVELVLVTLVVLSFIYLVNAELKIENVIGLMSLLGVIVIRLLQLTAGLMTDISRVRSVQHMVEQLVDELQRSTSSYHGKTLDDLNPRDQYLSENIEIALENITFKYPDTAAEIIYELSLNAKTGDVIGIVGDSGAGKSTLMNIIMGFFPITHGRITLSGQEICPKSLISISSYMTQGGHIFNDTLFNNLALGDASITEAYARDALVELNVMAREPKKTELNLDTIVGENGVSLSDGEAQRVSLARTYAHRSNIVVLDEPTSSLDEANEDIVMAYVSRHRDSKVTFIVSHKKRLLDVCNVVYRLKDGKLLAT